jgi:colanic acid/amylovoran biosynthesis glycosyltransferase
MASGLPVLATHHGGIPEAVTHGESGFLVAEGDAPAMARAALDLMESPVTYAGMVRAACAEVTSKFERQAQTAILEGFYDEAQRSQVSKRQEKKAIE